MLDPPCWIISRERIHVTQHRIVYLDRKCRNIDLPFKHHCQGDGDNKELFDKDIYDKVIVHVHHAVEAALYKIKIVSYQQIREVAIEQKDKTKNDPDLSGTLLKRWLKVLSQYKPMAA